MTPVSMTDNAAYAALATPLGALYGYLGLEALSGLAPALLIEIVGIALLARRLPHHWWSAAAAATGFLCGFAAVWVLLLAGRPYCCGPLEDALWAVGLVTVGLIPALAVWLATDSKISRRRPRRDKHNGLFP